MEGNTTDGTVVASENPKYEVGEYHLSNSEQGFAPALRRALALQ